MHKVQFGDDHMQHFVHMNWWLNHEGEHEILQTLS